MSLINQQPVTYSLSLIDKLNSYVGKSISQICSSMIAKINSQNHCAHFVSHALEMHKPGTANCKTFTYSDKLNENIKNSFLRVNEIFNNCNKRGLWDIAPKEEKHLLIFTTRESNIISNTNQITMGEHPVKHVGIYHNGLVWHYSNTMRMVKKDPINTWKDIFTRSYKDTKNSNNKVLFYFGIFS